MRILKIIFLFYLFLRLNIPMTLSAQELPLTLNFSLYLSSEKLKTNNIFLNFSRSF